jgi:hypothetical protein
MSARVGVHARDRAFVAATAELAPRTVPADDRADAVCIIAGHGAWWDHVASAAAAGARVVVVVEPGPAPDPAFDDLASLDVPVLISRARVRSDLVADATPSRVPQLITADVFAPYAAARAVVRDAFGWVRALGGETRLVSVAATARAVVVEARCEGVDGAFTLALGGPGTAPAIGMIAIGPTRVEVRLDEASGSREVTVSDASGSRTLPTRYESPERLILRRALDLGPGAVAADLDDLRADDRLAAAVLQAVRP